MKNLKQFESVILHFKLEVNFLLLFMEDQNNVLPNGSANIRSDDDDAPFMDLDRRF